MMLTPQCRELLRGPNCAVITTINADGTPQQSVERRRTDYSR